MNNIRWIDMVDPIYTLARLTDIDPDIVNIYGISVMDNSLIVWYYDENNVARHITKRYDLDL
jgi:hypothetical protein